MKRNQLVLFLVLSFFIKIINEYLKPSDLNIAAAIGGALGLFLFPYLITILIKGISKLFKIQFSSTAFFRTYMFSWILFSVSGFVILLENDTVKNTKYIYSPVSCKYEITFSSKPTIKNASVPTEDGFLNGEIAELSSSKDESFQRVEFYIVDKSIIENLDKESLYNILNQYSINNGLNNPEFTYKEGAFGRNVEMRAYKKLTDQNKIDRQVTYIASTYILDNNMVTLYAGCESKKYPTNEISQFLNSIKPKNQNGL